MTTIATWNVNSLRVRLPHLIEWLSHTQTDIVGLQELKLIDEKYPHQALQEIGYESLAFGQPTYNGVALVYRKAAFKEVHSVIRGNPLFEDEQKRLIAANFDGLDIVCGYFPNGQSLESDKYVYKLAWLDHLIAWLSQRDLSNTILLGDYNIAPNVNDTHDAAIWEGNILCSPPERERFEKLIALGLVDSFRKFDQSEKAFTWWDYRQMGYRQGLGLRIDHLLIGKAIEQRATGCVIDKAPRKKEQPSDHTPVILTIA
jgi:exodeoxyribonuclease III